MKKKARKYINKTSEIGKKEKLQRIYQDLHILKIYLNI